MDEANNVLCFIQAQKSRKIRNDLMVFLACPINKRAARQFVGALMSNNILFYFDEKAEDTLIISKRESDMLNSIIDRFKEVPSAYKTLFNEAEKIIFKRGVA